MRDHPPQEPDRVNGIVGALLTLFVLLVIAGSVGWSWHLLRSGAAPARSLEWEAPQARAERTPAEVRGLRQTLIGTAGSVGRESEGVDRLETFGWVDAERGLVRIPVERAMEVVVARQRQERGRQQGRSQEAEQRELREHRDDRERPELRESRESREPRDPGERPSRSGPVAATAPRRGAAATEVPPGGRP